MTMKYTARVLLLLTMNGKVSKTRNADEVPTSFEYMHVVYVVYEPN